VGVCVCGGVCVCVCVEVCVWCVLCVCGGVGVFVGGWVGVCVCVCGCGCVGVGVCMCVCVCVWRYDCITTVNKANTFFFFFASSRNQVASLNCLQHDQGQEKLSYLLACLHLCFKILTFTSIAFVFVQYSLKFNTIDQSLVSCNFFQQYSPHYFNQNIWNLVC